jgi:hypothetical protein
VYPFFGDPLCTSNTNGHIFKPTINLNVGSKYTGKISKDVKSLTGDSMEADKEWSFTTAAA